MEIQKLPMFRELSSVLCSYKIESWQTKDFWEKVKLFKIADNNENYQSIYRLLHRLVKENYLTTDIEKNEYGQKTYSELEKLQMLRLQYGREPSSTVLALNLKKEKFESELFVLEEEVDALEELKDYFPEIQFKIEQLKQLKMEERRKSESKAKAIDSLLNYLTN
jgi:DNA-binding PadR family transcriptional regulator